MKTNGPASHKNPPAKRTDRTITTRPVRPVPGEVIVVMNPDDNVAVAKHLAAIHDLDHGRVVVSPHGTLARSPGTRFGAARKRLGADLLAALGKDPDGIAHSRAETLALAGYWIRGERVSELVVDRAHALHRELLRELAGFARDAQIRLWLIWVANPLQRRDLGDVKMRRISPEQFRDALPAMPSIAPPPPPPSWPALPSSDFPVFMEVCRARIDPTDFRRVGETFDLAQEAATELAADLYYDTLSGIDDVHLLGLEAWLRDHVLAGGHHPSQLLVKLRGVQAGFFTHKFFLRWQPSLLPRRAEAHLPTRLTDDVAKRLRGQCSPDTAAALAVQLHLAADPSALKIGQLSADGATLTQRFSSFAKEKSVEHRFPRSAHGILVAHLAQRRGDGADEDSPLFASVPRPASDETLRLRFGLPMLAAAQVSADVPACSTPWLSERGLSLHRIDPRKITERDL